MQMAEIALTLRIVEFNQQKNDSVESFKTLEESLQSWLQVFKFPAVERSTYDRAESIAKNQVYPLLGKKVVGDITAADIKKLLNHWMTEDYAYTTVKKVYTLLNEYFRCLYQQEIIVRNPMTNVEMIKKANFMSAQGKENLPPTETITVFSEEEIEKFKAEAFSVFGNGKRKYQQAEAYILMLNTGLRTGEALGLLNSDIDLENRVMHIQHGVKEVSKRDGVTAESGREVTVGKLKSATSKRDVPLNDTAIEMIKDLRSEFYFGEDSPLIPDEHGEITRPVNFRKEILPYPQSSGHRNKRSSQPQTYLRHKIDQRHQRQKRQHQIPNSTPSSRPPRSYHVGNYRTILCQARFEAAKRDYGWV